MAIKYHMIAIIVRRIRNAATVSFQSVLQLILLFFEFGRFKPLISKDIGPLGANILSLWHGGGTGVIVVALVIGDVLLLLTE